MAGMEILASMDMLDARSLIADRSHSQPIVPRMTCSDARTEEGAGSTPAEAAAADSKATGLGKTHLAEQ
jgi:hypothetical protein